MPDFVKTDISAARGYMILAQHAFGFRRLETVGGEKYVVLTNNQEFAQNKEIKVPYEIFINLAKEIAIYGENVEEFREIYNNAQSKLNVEENSDNATLYAIAEEKLDKELLRTAKNITTDLKNALMTVERNKRSYLVHQYVDYLKTVAPNELTEILCSNELESLIKLLDRMEYGVLNKNAKKELIMPIVDAAYELCILKNGVNYDNEGMKDIQEHAEKVKKSCIKELDSFYTNENTIIDAIHILACEL